MLNFFFVTQTRKCNSISKQKWENVILLKQSYFKITRTQNLLKQINCLRSCITHCNVRIFICTFLYKSISWVRKNCWKAFSLLLRDCLIEKSYRKKKLRCVRYVCMWESVKSLYLNKSPSLKHFITVNLSNFFFIKCPLWPSCPYYLFVVGITYLDWVRIT